MDMVKPSLRKPFLASRWSRTSESSATMTYCAGMMPTALRTTPGHTVTKLCTLTKATTPPMSDRMRPSTMARFLPSLLASGQAMTMPTAEGRPPMRPSVDMRAPEVASGSLDAMTLSNIQRT